MRLHVTPRSRNETSVVADRLLLLVPSSGLSLPSKSRVHWLARKTSRAGKKRDEDGSGRRKDGRERDGSYLVALEGIYCESRFPAAIRSRFTR